MLITDFTHLVDSSGEICASMPREARELAGFLALVVDGMTSRCAFPDAGVDVGLRCRSPGCPGVILASVGTPDDPIAWGCSHCDQKGIVSHWRGSRWDNTGKRGRSRGR